MELHSDSLPDTYPLLMERAENSSRSEHIINIRSSDASSSSSHQDRSANGLDTLQDLDRHATTSRAPTSQTSIPSSNNNSNTRSSSFGRRGDPRRRRSPLNSGMWISIELGLTVSQIVASIVVLSVSKNEHPRAPLFLWIVGYAGGCVATLPLLYWRYRNRNQVSEQESNQPRQGPAQISVPAGPFSLSVTRTTDADDRHTTIASPRSGQRAGVLNARYSFIFICECCRSC